MKFLGRIVLLIALFFSLGSTAGAAYRNVPYLPDMEEYEEIKAALQEMVPEVNEILKEEGYDKTVTAEDILLEEGYPIYLNENYFSPEIDTPEDLLSLIEKQEHYVWKLPVKLNNQVLLLGLGKGYPVREQAAASATAEQLAEIEKNVGKWHLTTVEFVQEAELYTQKIKDAGIDAEQVFFVNGPAGNYIQMAICIDNGKFQDVLSLTNAEISSQGNDVRAFADGAHYTYRELQESLGMVAGKMGGGNGEIRVKDLTAGFGVVVIAALLFAFASARKKYKEIHKNK